MKKHIRNDLILIFFVLLVGASLLALWLSNTKKMGKKADIYHKDELILTLDLYKNQTVEIQGEISMMTIVVNYGKISVKESGCPNQICVHMGEKSMENDTITCLPNLITIIIRDGDSNE